MPAFLAKKSLEYKNQVFAAKTERFSEKKGPGHCMNTIDNLSISADLGFTPQASRYRIEYCAHIQYHACYASTSKIDFM